MEDVIDREINASIAFAEWRYEMEQENFELETTVDDLESDLKKLKKERKKGVKLPAKCATKEKIGKLT